MACASSVTTRARGCLFAAAKTVCTGWAPPGPVSSGLSWGYCIQAESAALCAERNLWKVSEKYSLCDFEQERGRTKKKERRDKSRQATGAEARKYRLLLFRWIFRKNYLKIKKQSFSIYLSPSSFPSLPLSLPLSSSSPPPSLPFSLSICLYFHMSVIAVFVSH